MESQETSPSNEAEPAVHTPAWIVWGLVGACALGCLVSLATARDWAVRREEATLRLAEAGVASRRPEAVERMRRESDPDRAGLSVARSLVYDALTRLGKEGRSPQLDAEVAAVLPQAASLARRALSQDPTSWQAPMLLGMSVYLERSLAQDRRLYTEAAAWEVPLTTAVERAKGHPEPRRLLATAYLETWHGLSPAKKKVTRDLLEQVFAQDIRAFEALLPTWLALRLPLDETFSVVPARASAWQVLTRGYAAESRWSAFVVAYDRYLTALESELVAQRDEAATRLRLGDFVRSRSQFLRVILQAPPSGRFLPVVSSVLETYPPGLHGLGATDLLQGWLEWSMELGLLGHEGLRPELLGRLLDAVGEIDPPRAGLAAVLAGDRYRADRYEKLARPLSPRTWAPYLVVKARTALAAGNSQEADEALSHVTLSYRRRPAYVAAELAAARLAGSAPRRAEAEEAWDAVRAASWTALDWRWVRDRPMLELVATGPAVGVEVDIATAPDLGAVVEASWNGRHLRTAVVRQGDTLRLDVPVQVEDVHLLELRTIAGGSVAPGSCRLVF